jgi:4-amino-4-deoxy-L-arabinose transferase-like glycosyltransferase
MIRRGRSQPWSCVASTDRRALDLPLLAILAAALLLRLGYPALVGLPDHTPLHGFVIDEQEYYGAAAVLASGRGLSFYDTFPWTRTAAYPLFVGALFALFGPQTGPVFVAQALLSVVTLYGLAWLAGRAALAAPALRLSRPAAERAAAALGAVWLPFTLFANLLLSETLFLLLIVGVFALLARYVDGRGHGLLLGAGLLLGLAALTRSTALAFAAPAALWLLWLERRGPARWRAPALLLAGLAVCLAPQVAYNYAAYHRLILGDTSSGYNLWLASVGVRDGARLAADLAAIPNPGDRQSYALNQALQNIAARPDAFLGKGLKESLDLWRVNFASEERQVRGFARGRVPAAHLWALFAGEDLLYVLLVLAGLLGLATGPPDPLKPLVGLWALTWMIMAFVFFAVTRFRFPVVALLLPWAPLGGMAVVRLLPARLRGQARGEFGPPSARSLGLFALGGLFLIVVAPSLDLPDTALGVTRWAAQRDYRAAVPLITAGRAAEALPLLARADPNVIDTQYATDAATLAVAAGGAPPDLGALERLARAPEIALPPGSPSAGEYEPYLLNGAIQRALGQDGAAWTAFGARPVHAAGPEAVSWAATFLPDPPGPHLDVGGDLDFGAVDGFYGSEQASAGSGALTFRWTGAAATVRLTPAAPWRELVVRWSGARPAGLAPAQARVTLRAGGQAVSRAVTLPAADTWEETVFPAPPGAGGAPVALSLNVNAFVPGGYDPRALGVRVDAVTLR